MKIAFACVLLAVVAAVVYMWRGHGDASHAAPDAAVAKAAAPAVAPAVDREAPRARQRRAVDHDEAELVHVDGLPTEFAEAHVAIEHAARSCFSRAQITPTAPGVPDETVEDLTLEYEVISTNGRGRAENLRPIETGLSNGDVEQCILAAAAGARWDSSGGDGTLGKLTQVINLGDLLEPIGPPPESERSPRPTAPPP